MLAVTTGPSFSRSTPGLLAPPDPGPRRDLAPTQSRPRTSSSTGAGNPSSSAIWWALLAHSEELGDLDHPHLHMCLTLPGLTELRLSVPEAGKHLLPLPVAVWHKDVGKRVLRPIAKGDDVLVYGRLVVASKGVEPRRV